MASEAYQLDMMKFTMPDSKATASNRELLLCPLDKIAGDELLVISMEAWDRVKGLAAVNGYIIRGRELNRQQAIGFASALCDGTYTLSDDRFRGVAGKIADMCSNERGLFIQSRQGR